MTNVIKTTLAAAQWHATHHRTLQKSSMIAAKIA
jgi:hypothetical protein